jgi:hypothetical protein
MPARSAVTLSIPRRTPWLALVRRSGLLARELLFAAALLAAGTVAVMLVSLLVVIAAPIAAGLLGWFLWRSGDVAAREARRVRARLRRRARALGLVVLAGSQPALLRIASGARPPSAPRAVR